MVHPGPLPKVEQLTLGREAEQACSLTLRLRAQLWVSFVDWDWRGSLDSISFLVQMVTNPTQGGSAQREVIDWYCGLNCVLPKIHSSPKHPQTCDWDPVWKLDLCGCNQVKMRSLEWASNPMTSVLKKREIWVQRCTKGRQREDTEEGRPCDAGSRDWSYVAPSQGPSHGLLAATGS